jgi:hypothetical protein
MAAREIGGQRRIYKYVRRARTRSAGRVTAIVTDPPFLEGGDY